MNVNVPLPVVLTLLGVIVTILVQTGAMFYWGGKLKGSVDGQRDELVRHEAEILRLRDWKHDQLAPWAANIEGRVLVLEDRAESQGKDR